MFFFGFWSEIGGEWVIVGWMVGFNVGVDGKVLFFVCVKSY